MTQNTIEFNSVKNSPLKTGTTLVLSGGLDENGGVINAVDIDWNGAVLPDSAITSGGAITINTTGDLLKLINDMQKEIYVLSAAIIALSGSLPAQS